MRILGVDPGLEITGYGVVSGGKNSLKLMEAGILKTSSKEKIEKRLARLHAALSEIIKEYKPDVLILEKLYSHYRHPVTAILMGHARGVICFAAGGHKVPVVSYPAKRVRKAVTGNGNASKHQVQRVVADLLHIKHPIEYTDLTDALALAITHIYMEG